MMKPGMGAYDQFKEMFDRFSKEAGKEQYLIPYFIAAHPGTTDEDMLSLAFWLKNNGFRADQVQTFYPSPMAMATAMYHTEKDPIHRINYQTETVFIPTGEKQRRLHKAFLRYHDPDNWPMLREALKRMGKAHLIGYGKKHLVPPTQPANHPTAKLNKSEPEKRRKPNPGGTKAKAGKGKILTQHTGLPPRSGTTAKKAQSRRNAKPAGRRK